jgi:hypothetical protein
MCNIKLFVIFILLLNNSFILILCQDRPGTGNFLNTLTDLQKQTVLDSHNELRGVISGPPASNLRAVYWYRRNYCYNSVLP